MSDVKNNA